MFRRVRYTVASLYFDSYRHLRLRCWFVRNRSSSLASRARLTLAADVVLWDSNPLALGATPEQVWIDGIPQIAKPYAHTKPAAFQTLPKTPDFEEEAKEALKYEGLPPLEPKRSSANVVVFTNVSRVHLREGQGIREAYIADAADALSSGVVVVRNGQVACVSAATGTCVSSVRAEDNAEFVDLEGGAVSPGLVSVGSPLGLEEMTSEESTIDGYVLDPLTHAVPEIAGGNGMLIRAADGLQFGTRDALCVSHTSSARLYYAHTSVPGWRTTLV